MDLNASVHVLDKSSSLLNSKSHLPLPFFSKTIPKIVYSTFNLNFFFDICCWWVFLQAPNTRRRRPVNQNKQQMSEKKEFQLKVEETILGIVFEKNGKGKCDLELSNEELLYKTWTLAFKSMLSYYVVHVQYCKCLPKKERLLLLFCAEKAKLEECRVLKFLEYFLSA